MPNPVSNMGGIGITKALMTAEGTNIELAYQINGIVPKLLPVGKLVRDNSGQGLDRTCISQPT